jgi:hypothetical protein
LQVIETLADVMLVRGMPEHIRSDNGPEFIAEELRKWLGKLGTKTLYIEPGSPWENGYCESLNGKLRDEFLNGEIYSYARGVSSARQISREMEHEPGLQWLAGMEVVNHHTLSDFRVVHGSALQNLMEQVLGVLFSEGLVGLERVTQDGTKIRAQASKRSFLDRKHLQQCLDLAKRHMAKVDADNIDQLSQHQEAARYRVQREREAKLQSALQSLSTIEQAKKHSEAKAAHVSISDPDARFMRQGDGAIAPSYNIQFTTDAAQGLVVGVAVSQASNDAKELPLAMDRFQQQYGSYPAQVVADGDFTNHESVIAMHQRDIEFFGSFGKRRLRRPKAIRRRRLSRRTLHS